MKPRRKITRAKKAKINEILTDSSRASGQLHNTQAANVSHAQENLRDELAELRMRFTGMVARGPMPIVVIDADGFIREANEAAYQLLGYAPNKLIYLSFAHLVATRDAKALSEHLQRCRERESEPVVADLRLMTAQSQTIAVRLNSRCFQRRGVLYCQIAIVDQTSVQQRADELKDARDFSQNIFQTIQQPLVVLDEQLQVVTTNRAFGHAFSALSADRAKSFVQKLLELPINGHTIRALVTNAISMREPIERLRVEMSSVATSPLFRRGDVPRTFLISVRPVVRQWKGTSLLLMSIEDVTKQQQAEAALRREQIMLSRAEALAHVGGWEWRLKGDDIVWSDELYKIFGVDKRSFTPTYTTFLELVHPEDRESVDALIRRGLSSGRPLDFRHRIVRGGEVRLLHCQGYFSFDAHGHPAILMGIAQDVTELQQAEEQLRSVNFELEERGRSLQRSYEEMQAFSYSIAHDLRAPLRAIQGMSRILMEDFADILDEDGQDYFSRIMDAAQRMDDLIRDLLDYARMTTVQLPIGPIDCESLWPRVLANFATEITDKNAVITKDQPLPSVSAHRTVVELALNNLLGNALKFFPKGGKPEITISTERRDGNRIRFNIQDKGIGIAPEHQQRIFRVFERLHPTDAYPGTGIGLAIVKKGIERVGGAVGLTSKPNEGSTFWFELPAAD